MGMIVSINHGQCPEALPTTMDRRQLVHTMRDLSIDSGNPLPLASREHSSLNNTYFRDDRTKQKHRESKPSQPHPLRKSNRRTRAGSLEPHSFEELHNERSYLTVNLQRQDERIKNLMAGILQAEDRCSSAQTPAEARGFRKQIGRLRGSLAEAERQEKLILLRLSELYIEIQGRERWCQVQQRRALSQTMLWQVDHPHGLIPHQLLSPVSPITPLPPGWYYPDPVSMAYPSPLSPMSPEFVPGAFSFRDLHWDANRSGPESSNLSPCWVREKNGDTPENPNDFDGWDANSRDNSRCQSTPSPSFSRTSERRLSLPTPDTAWILE